jgi:hypothetical protein
MSAKLKNAGMEHLSTGNEDLSELPPDVFYFICHTHNSQNAR